MKQLVWVVPTVMILLFVSCNTTPVKEAGRIIHIDSMVDLTHTLTDSFPFIPVKKLTYPFELIPMATMEKNGVAANSWKIHEHLGTHIDAPNHFIKNQKSVDLIDVRNLIVPVVVLDMQLKAARNSDALLLIEDIQAFEKQYGRIPVNACVMLYTGWDQKLSDPSFIGLDSNNVKHYPGFSTEAVQFLLSQREIAGIGTDVLSFDPGTNEQYSVHKILFTAGKWGVECVANLSKIPKTGATLIVGAPKVGNATGGLARIIAVW